MIEIINKIDNNASIVLNSTPVTILIDANKLLNVAHELHANSNCFFDQLSCVTGIDTLNNFEVIYHLYSIPFNISLALKVILPRDKPTRSNAIFSLEVGQLARARNVRHVWNSLRRTSRPSAHPHACRLGRLPASKRL